MAKKKRMAKKSTAADTPSEVKGSKRTVHAAMNTNASSSTVKATLDKESLQRIKGLLKARTSEGVILGLQLLDSLKATAADYELVFTDAVMKSILHKKAHNSWSAVVRALRPLPQIQQRLETLAESTVLRITDEIPCDTVRTLRGLCYTWPGTLAYQGWLIREDILTYNVDSVWKKRSDEQGRPEDSETLLIQTVIEAWDMKGVLPYFGEGVTFLRVTLTNPTEYSENTAEYFVHLNDSEELYSVRVGTRTTLIAAYDQD